ncbi:putative monoamine oxidase [Psychrobacter nivimaris]|uniref:Putative monoamine oxidase n=2 Tax=Psychrobacter TaxID=497 RepID=A0A6N7C009_9GAMM|nr:FAD-dependent oxidoreductase [Psychrobacter nivimaris]KAF0568591.1 putative monoamine oxidase [Psychrobacter nivimaris]|tara:strand:+ start:69 stop:1223 length:1155 start_codon:yes stop_codon:yes gene_type:complete
MQDIPVVIVGGGLSGLYAALLLEQKGIAYRLLEARNTLGGRIAVAKCSDAHATNNSTDIDQAESSAAFDLGPSWFWPDYQTQLSTLIESLDLSRFAQFEEGDMMVERAANQSPVRMQGYKSTPPSMRLVGGMATLIDALYARLDASCIMTGQTVKQLNKTSQYIEVQSEDSFGHVTGHVTTFRAQHVLLALPPRLVEGRIVFQPALPQDLSEQWRETATWMAPHAKYVAVYESPFWRDAGFSGAARSAIGPLTEIHDASTLENDGALFGFFGVPAQVRQSVSDTVLKEHCRAQLVRLFGDQASTPKAEYLKDWAQDPLTAMSADASGNGQHAVAPPSKPKTGVWQDCLIGCGSEWSAQFPGYVAGAIDAATVAVQSLPATILRQ